MPTGTLSGNSLLGSYGAPSTIIGTRRRPSPPATATCSRSPAPTTSATRRPSPPRQGRHERPERPVRDRLQLRLADQRLHAGRHARRRSTSRAARPAASPSRPRGATDADSDVTSYNYGAIAGTGWSNAAGAYTFTGASPTGTGAVTATNNAGLTGSSTNFNAVSDGNLPAARRLHRQRHRGDRRRLDELSDERHDADDRQPHRLHRGAGRDALRPRHLDADDRRPARSAATPARATAHRRRSAAPPSQTVARGNCYLLTLTGTDNVGNAATVSTTVKVDTTAPSAPSPLHVRQPEQRLLARGSARPSTSRPARRAASPSRRLHRRRHRTSPSYNYRRSPAPAGATARGAYTLRRHLAAPPPAPSPRRTTPASQRRHELHGRLRRQPPRPAARSPSTAPRPPAAARRAT